MSEPTEPDLRCPNCGAAVYAGAEWCNLCFTPIRRGADEVPTAAAATTTDGAAELPTDAPPAISAVPSGTSPGGPTPSVIAVEDDAAGAGAFWPCPVCQAKNPIALDACATCGTPFASVMRQERDRPRVDPSVAFGRSLLFPGLGHAKLGLGAEGFARGALFLILLFVTLLIGFAGASSPLLKVMLVTFATGTIGVYLLTAVEARRLAEGGRPMVSTRLLLWVTVGALMAAMALIVVVIGTTPTQ
ncbi:MAG TPA: hypothetical protein VIE12_00820 [Actinomycetota bacterium]|jgi:hypothetical protein